VRRRTTTALLVLLVLLAALTAACGGGGDAGEGAKPPASAAPASTTPAARPVVIIVDGKRTETTTTAATVREALTQAGIPLGEHDLVTPPVDDPVAAQINVVRLLSAPVTRTLKIDPTVVRKTNSRLAAWSERTVRKGRPGVKVVQTAWVKRRGKKVKAVISEKIKRKPVAQVVEVGPQPSSVGGAAAGLNWAGLAKCESGGRPNAVNPAGYYGLYQFSLQTWGSVGGSGLPSNATPAEQTYRAQLLYNKVSGRWQGQWPNCGRFLFS
jgi:resuscitation-promoting factor RpfB